MRILLTTTSFQDIPGPHQSRLPDLGHEVVSLRGPLSEEELLKHVGEVDALLCGDDPLTRRVLTKALPRLKAVSKYGIGLDKVDLAAATELGIPVAYCPGVNHATVAEHCFALMLALSKNLVEEVAITRAGRWERLIGSELHGKTMGIVGLGRIGKEIATRASAFGMRVAAHDVNWDARFAEAHGVHRAESLAELLVDSDVVSLNVNLSPDTRALMRRETLARMKPGALLINCARGELVDGQAVAEALASGRLAGYGADVLEVEPPPPDHPLLAAPRCLITPHIGSRTHESVLRQAGMAVENLVLMLEGKPALARAN